MNNWTNMMSMGQMPQMPPYMGGQPPSGPHNAPLLPPKFMLPEIGMNINPAPPVNQPPLIGPVLPDNMNTVDMTMSDEEKDPKEKDVSKDTTENKDGKNKDSRTKADNKGDNRSRESGRERENRRDSRDNRDRERGRVDQRSRDRGNRHDRNDRNDRFNRNDDRSRDRDRRERRSKWDDEKQPPLPMPPLPPLTGPTDQNPMMGSGMDQNSMMGSNMMMPMGSMMPGMGPGAGPSAGQSMGLLGDGPLAGQGINAGGQRMVPGGQGMGGQGMMHSYGMQNMQNMSNTQNIGNMQMMPGMNNMMGNNMIGNNMMGMNNMMMMNQQMNPMMSNQPVFLTNGILLPPVPGASMPNRRERPPGCRTIFVGGLPKGIADEMIEEIFQSFGEITDIKVHRQGVCHVRFEKQESVEASFYVSGYRFKTHDQSENEATTLFVDYALNRDDQNEYEKSQRQRRKTPPRIEPFNPANLNTVAEKIKNDEQFAEAAPTLIAWLEHGECNKRNANTFYSLIQASNNQVRRLFNDKMELDEEYQSMKTTLREKFAKVVEQFEQVARILSVAKHQRVSDHFTKQQRRNIEMWLKMTEEVENIKEEFNAMFDDEEIEKAGRNVVPLEKYEQLRVEHESLMYELEGYKNEAHLAKDEAERKFEKFKAHYIAQQALQNKNQPHHVFPPLPPPQTPNMATVPPMNSKPQPPPPTPDDDKVQTSGPVVPPSEAKLISILTAFLMVHPLGASLDYLVSYVRSMVPSVTQATVHQTLQKYSDVFSRKTSGIGANIENRWGFATFDVIKSEAPS